MTATTGRKLITSNKSTRAWCSNRGIATQYATHSKRIRCGICSRVLKLSEVYSFGEFVGYAIPPHKVKVKTYKRPSKNSRKGRRRR